MWSRSCILAYCAAVASRACSRKVIARQCCSKSIRNIQQIFQYLQLKFVASGVSEPDESAEFIVAAALDRNTLHGCDVNLPLTENEKQHILSMAELRLQHWPVQYVVGEWDFSSVSLTLRPPVFIPRPETEDLIEKCLSDPAVQDARNFLEIGCGSGPICITLLKHLPQARCTAIECSQEACQLTEHNAVRNGVNERLEIVNATFSKSLQMIAASHWQKFDFLISNPPYVRTEDLNTLQPEVIRFEDRKALDGGVDGMDTIREILCSSRKFLKSNGSVWLEVDLSHPPEVKRYIENNESVCRLRYVNTYCDFTDRPRICHLKVI